MQSERLDFSRRANLSEWMDEPCAYEELRACLHDLEKVNRISLGYRPTIAFLRRTLKAGKLSHVVDVGCGGGDTLRAVQRWALREGVAVKLTGIDLNPNAIRAAREFAGNDRTIEWIVGEAFSYGQPADVIMSSLVAHHLPESGIVPFLQWMEQSARLGWFVNDLERQPMPYHGFKLLSWAMRWHKFVRHDGPVSFRRAFREEDWRRYLAEAGVSGARLEKWKPARLCVARVK